MGNIVAIYSLNKKPMVGLLKNSKHEDIFWYIQINSIDYRCIQLFHLSLLHLNSQQKIKVNSFTKWVIRSKSLGSTDQSNITQETTIRLFSVTKAFFFLINTSELQDLGKEQTSLFIKRCPPLSFFGTSFHIHAKRKKKKCTNRTDLKQVKGKRKWELAQEWEKQGKSDEVNFHSQLICNIYTHLGLVSYFWVPTS